MLDISRGISSKLLSLSVGEHDRSLEASTSGHLAVGTSARIGVSGFWKYKYLC